MLKLRRLRIEKLRDIAPGTELRFSEGLNVLVGQNGAGKTTLLEIISHAVRLDFKPLRGETFDILFELSAGETRVLVIVRNRRAEVPSPTGEAVWLPSIHIRTVTKEGEVIIQRIDDELLVDGELVSDPLVKIILHPGTIPHLIHAYALPGQSAPLLSGKDAVRLDESLVIWEEILRSSEDLRLIEWRPDPLAFMYAGMAWPNLTPEGIMSGVEAAHTADRRMNRFVFTDRELDFLASAVRVLGFAGAQVHVDVVGRGAEYIDLGKLTVQLRREEGGDLISSRRLSFGQKRVLSFFFTLALCADIVIADELVNGLHHTWIKAAIDAIGERQAFLTSQNPLLFGYLPITSAEQVQKSFIVCRNERGDGRSRRRWENMSEEDARALFAACEGGLEKVSEMMQARGLW